MKYSDFLASIGLRWGYGDSALYRRERPQAAGSLWPNCAIPIPVRSVLTGFIRAQCATAPEQPVDNLLILLGIKFP